MIFPSFMSVCFFYECNYLNDTESFYIHEINSFIFSHVFLAGINKIGSREVQ